MIKIEKDKEYSIRLMPNIHDVPNSVIETKYTNKDAVIISYKYFSYVLNGNDIDHIMFGKQINDYINNCIHGFYGTSEGYFICKKDLDIEIPEFYYANKDKSIISTDEFRYGEYPEFTKYTDINIYEKIILFNIKEKYELVFKTRDNHGYLEIYNLGIKETKPLYKDGDDKDVILSLYRHKNELDVFVEQYKSELTEKYPEEDIVFGDKAQKRYWDKKSTSESIFNN